MAIEKFGSAPDSDTKPNKVRWGDLEEEEDYGDSLYKFNDEGNEVKITTTTRVRNLSKAEQRIAERRAWPKFGDEVDEDTNARLTMVSTEEIFLERPRPPGTKPEETEVARDNLAQLGKAGGVLMVCRTCGKKGDHWTSKCPYKDLAPQTDASIDKPTTSDASLVESGANKGAYVPPSMRAGAERPSGLDLKRRNDENSVRVTNLSEDTREPDLLELFSTFGPVTRVYVAIDQNTGMSRGFGFVNFVNREDAERAINKLNGYGYDNLILRVELATPRSN